MSSNDMPEVATRTLRKLSISSIVFGLLGGAFFWWVPLGIVLSLTGLAMGFVDALMARRRSLSFRISLVGIVISALALALDTFIALAGLQAVTFGGF